MKTLVKATALVGAVFALTALARGLETRPEAAAPNPIKITKEVSPQFPVRLMNQGVTFGEAVALISVDQTGKLLDCLVPRYTHREFAEAVKEAVNDWQFAPAGTQPAGMVFDVTFRFEINGVLAIQRFGVDYVARPVSSELQYVFKPVSPSELDRPLKLTRVVTPQFPESFAKQGIRGDVLVEFYVDEQGRARIPIATQAPFDVLGSLARMAVEQWQFQPPTRDGKPVLVRVTQKFAFQE